MWQSCSVVKLATAGFSWGLGEQKNKPNQEKKESQIPWVVKCQAKEFGLQLWVIDMVLMLKGVFFTWKFVLQTVILQRILFVILLFSSLDCRVEAKLEHWYITGLRQQDIIPSLVASIGDTASSLLKIEFETNPESSTADQTLVVQSQAVEVIYDAVSTRRKWILIKHILSFWQMVSCFFFFIFNLYLPSSSV